MTDSLPSAPHPTSPVEPSYHPILRSLPTLILYPSSQFKQKTPAKPQVKHTRKQSGLPSDLETLGSPRPNPSVSSFAQQQSAAATSCPHYLCLHGSHKPSPPGFPPISVSQLQSADRPCSSTDHTCQKIRKPAHIPSVSVPKLLNAVIP